MSRILYFIHDKVLCPISWKIEKMFGYYSKQACSFRGWCHRWVKKHKLIQRY